MSIVFSASVSPHHTHIYEYTYVSPSTEWIETFLANSSDVRTLTFTQLNFWSIGRTHKLPRSISHFNRHVNFIGLRLDAKRPAFRYPLSRRRAVDGIVWIHCCCCCWRPIDYRTDDRFISISVGGAASVHWKREAHFVIFTLYARNSERFVIADAHRTETRRNRDNLYRDANDYIIFTRLDRLLSTTGGA